MVSVLNSGVNTLGSSPGGDIVLCCWASHLTHMVPLSTRVYKWVSANLLLGGNLAMTSIPCRGSKNTPSPGTRKTRNWDKLWPDGPPGHLYHFTE